MRGLSAAFLVALILPLTADFKVPTVSLVGTYAFGDGLGMNISVVLKPDGRFDSEWLGCMGSYGKASGRWQLHGSQIQFVPAYERGMLKNFFRVATAMSRSGQIGFVRAQRQQDGFDEFFLKHSRDG